MSQQLGRYRWLLRLLSPALMLMARKQDPARFGERLADYSQHPALPDKPIWLHAASYGEAKAAGALVESMRAQGYEDSWVVTTTTRTGGEAVQAFLRPGDCHLYAPIDLPGTVDKALAQIDPQLLIVMEVEIWPNLWATCEKAGVPIVLANARLSDSSLKKYQKFLPQLWCSTLQRAALILPQSEAIAARFAALGVDPQRMQIAGNLKYSQPLPEGIEQLGADLRQQLGSTRPVWLAASTHEGEETIALETHQQLLKQFPELLLVLVPRHPQRFDRVFDQCQQSGLYSQRRSADSDLAVAEDTQVYLADTLGELLGFYQAIDLCWVGGSFVDVGGHNILEPAACDCAMVVGPDMRNFEAMVGDFLQQQALRQVEEPAQLGAQLAKLLDDAQERGKQAGRASRLSLQQVGAAEQQARTISVQLPGFPSAG